MVAVVVVAFPGDRKDSSEVPRGVEDELQGGLPQPCQQATQLKKHFFQ